MKKIFSCLAAIGCLTMLLTACNNSEDTTADVVLGQYKGIEVTVPGVEVVYRGVGKDRIRLVLNHNAQRAEYRGQALEPFQCLITPAAE